jgi:hypothetical protein
LSSCQALLEQSHLPAASGCEFLPIDLSNIDTRFQQVESGIALIWRNRVCHAAKTARWSRFQAASAANSSQAKTPGRMAKQGS